ncbi:MAG: hypothetical protein IJA62_06005 [Ruminococcus sp.]|nr:hypothetical protein [Ruminococcus sp.]
MASKNKTENLGLNLWEGTDRPQRGDFNSDNMILDEALGEHIASSQLHLTQAEKARVTRPVQYQSYLGNGEAQATLSLSFTPSMVVVYCDSVPPCIYDSTKGCTKVYSAVAVYGAGSSSGAAIEGSTLKFTQDTAAKNGAMSCLNESGKQYRVAIIR